MTEEKFNEAIKITNEINELKNIAEKLISRNGSYRFNIHLDRHPDIISISNIEGPLSIISSPILEVACGQLVLFIENRIESLQERFDAL